MNLKNFVFLLLNIWLLHVAQLEAALTPGNIPSAACCSLGAVAPRGPNAFSCESFANQGIQLPPCDAAQARLWQNMLQDPELQGQQSGSGWEQWTLPALSVGVAGTTTAYNLWKLRKRQQESTERKAMERQQHETTRTAQPTPATTIQPTEIRSTQTPPSAEGISTQTDPIVTPKTPWWKQPYVMPTACAATSFGGARLAYLWSQKAPNDTSTRPPVAKLDLTLVHNNRRVDSSSELVQRNESDVFTTARTDIREGINTARNQRSNRSPTDLSPKGSPRQSTELLILQGIRPYVAEDNPGNDVAIHAPSPHECRRDNGSMARTSQPRQESHDFATQYSPRPAAVRANSIAPHTPRSIAGISSLPRATSLPTNTDDTQDSSRVIIASEAIQDSPQAIRGIDFLPQNTSPQRQAPTTSAAPSPDLRNSTVRKKILQGEVAKIDGARTTAEIMSERGRIEILKRNFGGLSHDQTFPLSILTEGGQIVRIQATKDELTKFIEDLEAALTKKEKQLHIQRSNTAPASARPQ